MTLHIPLWAIAIGLSILILWQMIRPLRDEKSAYAAPILRMFLLIPLLIVWLVYAILT